MKSYPYRFRSPLMRDLLAFLTTLPLTAAWNYSVLSGAKESSFASPGPPEPAPASADPASSAAAARLLSLPDTRPRPSNASSEKSPPMAPLTSSMPSVLPRPAPQRQRATLCRNPALHPTSAFSSSAGVVTLGRSPARGGIRRPSDRSLPACNRLTGSSYSFLLHPYRWRSPRCL